MRKIERERELVRVREADRKRYRWSERMREPVS